MYKNILRIILISSQLSISTFACNYKRLDIEPDSIYSKISSSIPISENTIRRSLDFLYNNQDIDVKYLNLNNFNSFYEDILSKTTDKAFINFVNKCNHIYLNMDNSNYIKAATFILAEKVRQKHFASLKLQNKYLNASEKQAQNYIFSYSDRVIDNFFKTSKNNIAK